MSGPSVAHTHTHTVKKAYWVAVPGSKEVKMFLKYIFM